MGAGLARGVRCLEIGGGRGPLARWLCEHVAAQGQVMVTDLETGFLSGLALPNLTVLTGGPPHRPSGRSRLHERGFTFIGGWERRRTGDPSI